MSAPPVARFVQGATLRHVIEGTVTGAIGLMAIFFVDFLSLFYISRLDDDRLTAGVGYATTILFVGIAVNIGLMIAGSALVSRKIGAGDRAEATRLAGTALCLSAIVGVGMTLLLLALLPVILPAIGASGTALEVATRFLWIALPSNALMAVGMGLSGLLRAIGDPRRSMNVTLIGGVITAITDPVLIFGFGLGTDGAAIATVLARLTYLAVGWYGLVHIHKFVLRPDMAGMIRDIRPFFGIAGPAILTNIATPIANLALLRILAPFGEAAIAANAILDRLIPLAFGVLFALSGAVGPILGQNLGAGRFDRVRQTMRDALMFVAIYCLFAWALLVLFRGNLATIFQVDGATARYLAFFCIISGAAWMFNGFLFVANAAFNNLGFPLYSTAFNWGRATIGTIPVAIGGAAIAGVEGAMTGVALGSMVFGLLAAYTAFRAIRRLEAAKS